LNWIFSIENRLTQYQYLKIPIISFVMLCAKAGLFSTYLQWIFHFRNVTVTVTKLLNLFSKPLRYVIAVLVINLDRLRPVLSLKNIKTECLFWLGLEKRCQSLVMVTVTFQKWKIYCMWISKLEKSPFIRILGLTFWVWVFGSEFIGSEHFW